MGCLAPTREVFWADGLPRVRSPGAGSLEEFFEPCGKCRPSSDRFLANPRGRNPGAPRWGAGCAEGLMDETRHKPPMHCRAAADAAMRFRPRRPACDRGAREPPHRARSLPRRSPHDPREFRRSRPRAGGTPMWRRLHSGSEGRTRKLRSVSAADDVACSPSAPLAQCSLRLKVMAAGDKIVLFGLIRRTACSSLRVRTAAAV